MSTRPFSRTLLPALTLALGSMAGAQLIPDSYTGTIVYPDSSPYTGSPLDSGTQIFMKVGGGAGSTATSVFKPQNMPDQGWRRRMIKFEASLDGDFFLPSDREGNESLASPGERRVFGTWNPAMWWQGGAAADHRFASSVVENSNGDPAQISIEVQEAPRPVVTSSSGSFLFDALDGSAYDQNPAPNQVELNRGLTPILTINFTIPTYTWTRTELQWIDGTTSSSVNIDGVSSSMWMVFRKDQNWSGDYTVFSSSFAPVEVFSQFEGLTTRTISGWSGQMTLDISNMGLGIYDILTSDLTWNQDSHDDILEPGFEGQYRNMSFQPNINVVPEPGTLMALGAGAALLARRRRKKA
ncbi:MAG TPA: PEP-CTERM sorting domain-containing protein [Fimbriimonadaceae bacterium]|nr:PEP-CTERM sorting domain-containing protein [Fimbriimonadaceae bacterium]HRJ33098.1 PEP-CTERM sorting domain-containing protein [Fimbriimonadaceae bacterium]